MKRSFFVGSTAAGACLCLLSQLDLVPALAHEADENQVSPPAQKARETETAAIFQEIQVFSGVKISMRVAMAAVEKQLGSKVVDASFDGRADRPAFRIKAYQNKKIWNGAIDASTGTIIGEGLLTAVSILDVRVQVDLAGLRGAGIDLSDAAEVVEKHTGGKAVSAGLGEVAGKLVFLIVVVVDGNLKEVSIDPGQRRK